VVGELRATLEPNLGKSETPIMATQAINDIGIEELYQAVISFRKFRAILKKHSSRSRR